MKSAQKNADGQMKKLGAGIYKDGKSSIRAVQSCAAGRKEKRFPLGTPLQEIKRWRNQTKVKLEALYPQKRAGAIARGTFSADVKRYLAHLTIASWASRRSELRAWEERIGRLRRAVVTADHVRKALKAWDEAGVPPKTALNRVLALTALYHTLDGPKAWTPADDVARPKPPRRRPVYVGPETIIAVEARLRELEATGGDPKTRGRFMVLAATGARPVHLKRATPGDVNLERRVWSIPSAKDGEPIELWLNADMLAAWAVFIAADAWGDFNAQEYANALRAAGWPADVRPYNAKHAVGKDLGERGVDMQVIADWFGHTKTETTRIYVPVLQSRIRKASEAMEGRLKWGATPPDVLRVDVGKLTADERKALLRRLLEDADA